MATKKINIEKLIDSTAEFASSNPEILDDMLIEYGYDPKQLAQKGESLFKKLLFQNAVEIKRNKLSSLYLKALQLVQHATVDTKATIFNLLQQKAPSFQFNKLDKLDIENLKQILNETELLDLIDKLEKDNLK
jgi:hypothetical protein